MSETTTETAKTQTEAATSTETATTETATTLLGTEAKTEQASGEQTQTTETKTEATKTEEKTETKTEEKKVEGAPEKYEFANAEKYDPKVLATFSESAKEANLSQEAAQKLLEKVAPSLQARADEQVKAIHQQWTEASTTDKEFGGEKLKENLGVAKKGLDQFGSPELKQFLEASGLGNHPEFIRYFFKVGKAISEDKFVSGSASNGAGDDPAKRLFPNQA